jgi:hypothetical protein
LTRSFGIPEHWRSPAVEEAERQVAAPRDDAHRVAATLLALPAMSLILMASALVLASVTIVSPLAGALEAPGDVRLERESYVAVRGVYYPGFTIAGVAEPLAVVVLALLLVSMSGGTLPFWLVALALAAEALAHLMYWVMIAPMNGAWLDDPRRTRAANVWTARTAASGEEIALRDRWEVAHVCRALAATLAFVVLVAATLAASGRL